jgi:putative FmdB family regulatory protein
MPLYEYICVDCNHTVEVIQKFSDPDLSDCGECGGALEKVLSVPAIRFKGSGWYITDYARKDSNGHGRQQTPSSSKEGGSKTGSESSPDSKAKPESRSEVTT